jgi:hypothetical protein
MRDVLRTRQQRRWREAALRTLRAQLQLGVDALARGDADDLEEPELDGYLA